MRTTKFMFFAGLFIAWAFLVALFIVGFSTLGNNSSNTILEKVISNNNLTGQGLILNLQEVAKHNSASDCWMIINNKVYDITPYVNSHPGGKEEMLKGCGIDATSLYNTKDNQGKQHSSAANSMLDAYYIGDLNQNIALSELQNKTSFIKNITILKSQDDEDEYEDD